VSALVGDFSPPPFLRGAHVQSVLASLPPRRWFVRRRAAGLLAASRSLLVETPTGVRLKAEYTPAAHSRGDLVVLLHGWEGSSASTYVLSCGAGLREDGYDVVRLNFRDHGGTQSLNPEIFHSCRLDEVVAAIGWLRDRLATQRVSLVGYSLGGNFALRAAAQMCRLEMPLPARVVAVCPVLDPARTLWELERGSPLYRRYFESRWRASLAAKHRVWPDRYRRQDLLGARGLREMTAQLVVRYTEFPSLDAYLNGYALVDGALEALAVPADVLLAADDPIVSVGDVARLAGPAALAVHVTSFGGHCGFIERLTGESWADRRIRSWLADN
jgi:hypothetical protein